MNKIFEIKANFLSIEKNEEFGYFQVAFTDDEFECNNYVLLNRSFIDDAQNKELDMSCEYIEINDQVNSGYNLCKNAILGTDFFKLIFKSNYEFSEIFIDISSLDLNRKAIEYLIYILEDKIVFI